MPAQILVPRDSTPPVVFWLHSTDEAVVEAAENLARGRSTIVFAHRRDTAARLATALAVALGPERVVELRADQSPSSRAAALDGPDPRVVVATDSYVTGYRLDGAAVLHVELPPCSARFTTQLAQRQARSTDPSPSLPLPDPVH